MSAKKIDQLPQLDPATLTGNELLIVEQPQGDSSTTYKMLLDHLLKGFLPTPVITNVEADIQLNEITIKGSGLSQATVVKVNNVELTSSLEVIENKLALVVSTTIEAEGSYEVEISNLYKKVVVQATLVNAPPTVTTYRFDLQEATEYNFESVTINSNQVTIENDDFATAFTTAATAAGLEINNIVIAPEATPPYMSLELNSDSADVSIYDTLSAKAYLLTPQS